MNPLVFLLLAAAPVVPAYPGARQVSLEPGLEAGGERFECAYFVTGDSPERVVDHYAVLWEGQGYLISVEGWKGDRVVSAYLPRESLQLAVVATRSEGRTLAFQVVRRLPRGELAPIPPGPEGRVESLREERPEGAFHIEPGTVGEVWRARNAYWAARQWKLVEGSGGGEVLALGKRRLEVTLRSLGSGRVAVLERELPPERTSEVQESAGSTP